MNKLEKYFVLMQKTKFTWSGLQKEDQAIPLKCSSKLIWEINHQKYSVQMNPAMMLIALTTEMSAIDVNT